MTNHKETGRVRYERLRAAGVCRPDAMIAAGISLKHARYIDNLRNREAGAPVYQTENHDDRYSSALIALGGLPRLSEKQTISGHIVCLPLIPFGVQP